MSELDPTVTPEAPAEPDDASIEAQAITDANGNKTVSLRALQEERTLRQSLQARIKELEPVANRTAEIEGRLNEARPIIDAVLKNPNLRAQVLRAADQTRPSGEAAVQPEDDEDARGQAEDFGWYLQDGMTPDIARGRRALDRMARVAKTQAENVVRPLAGYTMNSRADANLRSIMDLRDDNGTPYATPESIRECAEALGVDGKQLMANQNVAELILQNAIGRDRMKGRTVKAQEEPLYMEAGAGRRSASAALSSEDREWCERNGVDPKRFQSMNVPTRGGRGIELGGKK